MVSELFGAEGGGAGMVEQGRGGGGYYKAAFGAEDVKRPFYPKRKADQKFSSLLSAKLKIGPTVFVVSDLADKSLGGSGMVLRLGTNDVFGVALNNVKDGAAEEEEITKDGDGGISTKLKDSFGTVWAINFGVKDKGAAEAHA